MAAKPGIMVSAAPLIQTWLPAESPRDVHVHRQAPRQLGSSSSERSLNAPRAVLVLVPLVAVHARGRRRRRFIARRARPYPSGRYDHTSAAEYFSSRPYAVFSRATELAGAAAEFGFKLLVDKQTGSWEANEKMRAKELTDLITRLGPTFIKIGQALSIRADLLSPAYLIALTELQDRVPPVPNEQADSIIEEELGQPVMQIFEEITPKVIASASLGQVYKAKIKDGPDVAVKVQRPGMEDVIALDLFLLRSGADPLKTALGLIAPLNTDLVGLVDAWGEGFVGELDYRQEAKNAVEFNEAIAKTPLGGVVCAPPVVDELTTGKVLVTEWILGERLEQSTGQDVTKLCSVAMNTYLTMLLQTGVLHADPHPGNLLRMPDGRLCILDWGLVTSMDTELQFTFIEHIAHLVSRDYKQLPRDLTLLGFVPEGKEEEIANSEVVDVLSDVYSQWTAGGGAAGIDVNRFLSELQGLSGKYGSIFRVPPYFFYIARAFAVLEGIGLSNDSSYSIVSECLPYVSQRLLTDSSPRAAGALETYIYGEERDKPDRSLQVQKIEYLVEGYSGYSSAAGGLVAAPSVSERTGKIVEQLADLFIGDGKESATPTPLQQIVLDELAKVLGAGARNSFASFAGFSISQDGSSSEGTSPRVVTPDAQDERTLDNARRLATLVEPQVNELIQSFRALTLQDQVQVASEVMSKLWAYREGTVAASGRLLRKLVAQGLNRAAEDLRPR